MKITRKRLTLLVLLALLGSVLAGAPLLIRHLAEDWLLSNGADKATIGNVDLNIFTGKLGVFDVDVEKDGIPTLKFWRLTADINWLPLLRKRIFINHIWLYELDMLIRQDEQGGVVVGGIRLPAGESEGQADEAMSANGGGGWGMGLNVLGIRNSVLRIQSPEYNADERIDIKSFYIDEALSWQPDKPAPLNFDMLVNGKPLRMTSKVRAFNKTPDVMTDLQIESLDLSHYAPIAKLFGIDELAGIVSLDMDGVLKVDPLKQTTVSLQTTFNLEQFHLRRDKLLLSNDSLIYTGASHLAIPADNGAIVADVGGSLTLNKHHINMDAIEGLLDHLQWQGDVRLQLGGGDEASPTVTAHGNLSVSDLIANDTRQTLNFATADHVSAEGISVASVDDIRLDALSLTGLTALTQQEKTNPTLPEIKLQQGALHDIHYLNKQQHISVADADLSGLGVGSADQRLQLGDMGRLLMKNLAVTLQQTATVQSLTLNAVQGLIPQQSETTDRKPVVSIGTLQLDNMTYQFQPQALGIDAVAIKGLNVSAKRESDGSLYAIKLLPAGAATNEKSEARASGAAESTPSKAGTQPFQFRVNRMQLTDDSQIHFIDESVQPHFELALAPLSFTVEHLDSQVPDSKTLLNFNASLAKGNRVTVKGWLTPFAGHYNADIKTDIKALDLVFVSPYANEAIGYLVRSGRLNAQTAIKVHDDKLEADNRFEFQRLNLTAGSNDARVTSSNSIGIPLGAALALMKDGDGNIKLDVPIKGNLKDPEFKLGPAIRSAATEAVKKASVAYASYALQPYGAILLGAKLLSAATAMRLESVYFDPGRAELNVAAKEYLGKIAALMKDRPGINLTLCGNATPSDKVILQQAQSAKDSGAEQQAATAQVLDARKKALVEALHQLAGDRGENVKSYLMNTKAIKAERFFDCQTDVSDDESVKPQVALGM